MYLLDVSVKAALLKLEMKASMNVLLTELSLISDENLAQ